MSEPCLIDLRAKPNAFDLPTNAELELLASVLPELLLLMQQQDEAED